MRIKKLLAMGVLSIAFLSAGRIAFAESVSIGEGDADPAVTVPMQEEIVGEMHQPSDRQPQALVSEPERNSPDVLSDAPSAPEQISEVIPPEQEEIIADAPSAPVQISEVIPPEQEEIISDPPSAPEQISEVIPSEPRRMTVDAAKTTEQISGETSLLTEQTGTQEKALSIVRQPVDQRFVPGFFITLSIKAEGKGLSYQWYYKKLGQTGFSEWSGRTHANESVVPNQSWDGIELYCEVTDANGNKVKSDTITVCNDDTMTVLAVGDSICRGTRNCLRGYVGHLGIPYLNLAASGASLSTERSDVTTVPDQLANATDLQPDIIIAEGGLNDLCQSTPIGEIPTKPAVNAESLDISTVMGGLQRAFLIMREKYPSAQHYFLINHKVFRDGVYYVTTPNQAGYTQKDLHDAFVACCGVYHIGVIDIFEESSLDTSDSSFLSSFDYNKDTDPTLENARSNETDYVNNDGVHPLERGYLEYYVPIILDHITIKQPKKQLVITEQPHNQNATSGEPITVSVKASGDFIKYQWYYRKEGQSEFNLWRNRVRPTETAVTTESWNGMQVYCRLTDKYGNSVQSKTITVTVEPKLAITGQPRSCAIALGESLTLSAKAQGMGLQYQWYYKKEGQSQFSEWPSRIRPTETVIPPDSWNGIQLFCIVTDKYGNSVQSETITVTVEPKLAIIEQPKNCEVTRGKSLTLSVKAQGIGLQYKWYYRKKGQRIFTLWNGRTHDSEIVIPPDSWNGIQLYCLISDKYGNSVKSTVITVKFKRAS